MIDKAIYDEYEKALGANATLVERALLMLDFELSGLTGTNLQAALAARYAEIVLKYGAVAAQCAVEFYTRVRADANIDTEYTSTQAPAQSNTYLIRDAQYAIRNSASPASYTKNLVGRAVKHVYEQADNTIMNNAQRDPARPKWALVPHIGACGLCIMLCSQGFVYRTDKTAGNARHTNCKCVTVADFDTKNPYLEGYDPDGMADRYLSCREAIEEDAKAKGRVLYGKNITRSTGEAHDAYDAYLRNRIVKEMNTRDREWLRTGKIPSVTKDSKARPLLKERSIAQTLANNGFAVHFRETRSTQNKKTSAVLLGGENGVPYEIKQPTGNGKQTIYHQFEHAAGQSNRLILDATVINGNKGGWNSKTTEEAVRKYINWHYQANGKTIQFEDVLLIDGAKIKRIKRES